MSTTRIPTPSDRAVRSTLDDAAKAEVQLRLQPLLVDLLDLALTGKQLHWTVVGGNLARTRRQIAELKRTQARRPKDLTHKVSAHLPASWESVAVEDLKVANMMATAKGTVAEPGTGVAQKRGLNRSIAGEGWGMLRTQLAYKTARAGGQLIEMIPGTPVSPATCVRWGMPARGRTKPRSYAPPAPTSAMRT